MTGRKGETNKPVGSKMPVGIAYSYRFQPGAEIAERYKVIIQLGFGSFSEVYRCRDMRLGREVAIKTIPREHLDPQILPQIQAAAGLEHPHIVQIYDVAEPEKELWCISMRLLLGGTLKKKLDEAESRWLPLDEATLRILADVAEALDYAHNKGVVHHDVKPSNILLDEQGRAYLGDFGLAQIKKLTGESAPIITGMQMWGTIPYMSPEQVQEQPVDRRSDVYALGVVAYEVFTGQLPYRGRVPVLLAHIISSEPFSPCLANSEIPEGVEKVLLTALDKDVNKRYQTCGEFISALRQASQAYLQFERLYEKSIQLMATAKWHQVLDVLRQLEKQAPGHKDTRLHLERARKQVRLRDLYAEAVKLLKTKKYRECLKKLDVISGLDAAFDVAELRGKAQKELADRQKEALDELYSRAVKQFEATEYRACLDTLETIWKQDSAYVDDKKIEQRAQVAWKQQRYLVSLYQTGLEQVQANEWDAAIETFKQLNEREPGYKDVEGQLILARHMARLFGIHQRALRQFEQKEYAACMDKLDELVQVDPHYNQVAVSDLRQRAVDSLYQQAMGRLASGVFEDALETLQALVARAPEHGDPEGLIDKALAGIAVRRRQEKLETWYEEAQTLFKVHRYQACLDKMAEIRSDTPEFPDHLDVERRAREGLGSLLSQRAIMAYNEKQYEEAMVLWNQARQVAPDCTLPLAPYARTKDKIEKPRPFVERVASFYERMKPKLRPKLERQKAGSGLRSWRHLWSWGSITGAMALLLLSLGLGSAFDSNQQTSTVTLITPTQTGVAVSVTSTPTHTPTMTPTPTPTTTPTPTPTSMPTRLPTSTSFPTPSPTLTVMPSPIPDVILPHTPMPTWPAQSDVAVCVDPASILAAPSAGADELDFVQIDEEVTVLGRASTGNWLYVRNDAGVEGFVWRPFFDWAGDPEALPIRLPTVTVTPPLPTNTPTPSATYEPLSIDFWPVPEDYEPPVCHDDGTWSRVMQIRGQGGNQTYTYYQNGEIVAGPLEQDWGTAKDELIHVFTVKGHCGAALGVTGRVSSGDGQIAEKELFLASPGCCD